MDILASFVTILFRHSRGVAVIYAGLNSHEGNVFERPKMEFRSKQNF